MDGGPWQRSRDTGRLEAPSASGQGVTQHAALPGGKALRDRLAEWTSIHGAQAAFDVSDALQAEFKCLSHKSRLSFYLHESDVLIQ